MDSAELNERPLLAEDCLLAQLFEGLLTRKLTLKLDESASTQLGPLFCYIHLIFRRALPVARYAEVRCRSNRR